MVTDMERELRDMMERTANGVRHAPPPSRRLVRRAHLRRARTAFLVGTAAVALGIGGFAGASSLMRDEALPPVNPYPNESAFADTWVGTDMDGSTQTMVVRRTGEGAFDIVASDDYAGVCSGTPSTMTGTGRLNDAGELVVPSPSFTCDDGSEAKTEDGLPVEQVLRDLTFVYHVDAGAIEDNFGVVWHSGETIQSSGGMWPQSSLQEIREAQRLADEDDARYTWQLDPRRVWRTDPSRSEIFVRFLQEELGWREFRDVSIMGGDVYETVVFARCAAGRTNPLYPNDPEGRGCAPTIDEFHYETVKVNVAQLDERSPSGIWVVTGWTMPRASDAPVTLYSEFEGRQVEQVVPPTDAEATGLLEGFLQARIDGEGAEEYLHPMDFPGDAIPLLYTTSSGAPYGRFNIERTEGPVWPFGNLEFKVRLFAEGGNTVVAQRFSMYRDEDGRLGLDYFGEGTTENGKVVPEPSSILGGQVTYFAAPSDWIEISAIPELGYLQGDSAQMEVLPNSLPPDCDASGGTPPSADALVRTIRSSDDLESTTPVPAQVGGVDALRLDVTAVPGALGCGGNVFQVVRSPYYEWSGALGAGDLGRLYVLDLPEPLRAPAGAGGAEPVRTLTILIRAQGENFEKVVASVAPILDSFEFHAK